MATAPPPSSDPLQAYRAKRRFELTPEPAGELGPAASTQRPFVVQKHAASRLHYDLRLELDGVMLSWAVPKGPSYDPADKRIAVRTEDHPLSYNSFEGTIPRGQYGAGTVIVWDRGTWEPQGDPRAGLAAGKLLFTLHGHKLGGLWELVNISKPGDKQPLWILFKKRDAWQRPQAVYDVVKALPDSVIARPLGAAQPPGPTRGRSSVPATGQAATAATQDDAPMDTSPAAVARLPGARKAPLPARLAPQLATLSTGVPPSGDWRYEIKFDGYRLMARIEGGQARLITRGGHDWTRRMPGLAATLDALGLEATWLDGEIVVLGPDGLPDFNALQNAFDRPPSRAGAGADAAGIVYFVFDVPHFEGHDLRQTPQRDRRRLLEAWITPHLGAQLRHSADFIAEPAALLQSAQAMKLEGLIAKRGDAPYVGARTDTWLKLKCRQRQEFVVAGFTDRGQQRDAAEVGSLVLAVHDEQGRLVPVGNVGTGWSAEAAAQLKRRLLPLEVDTSPLAKPAKPGRWTQRPSGSERWVKPTLVAEVKFSDWTPDGQVRHASFEGLRADKPAREVTRERGLRPADALPLAAAAGATQVSHPERVVDPSSGATKLDLVRYYESVAEWLLPHLRGRPCSLVRGPSGIAGELFFQKHADKLQIPELRQLDPALWPEHEALIEVPSITAIAGAAQMNVIEFHTWNALARRIDRPDRLIFDLDPGEGVAWRQVQEAALLLRSFLTDLGLEAWLKTSGGKGLHVVVPLAPRHDWATVRGLSQAVVQHMAKVVPSRFVDRSGPANRVGKVYIDYLRNGHGATTAAAFTARARPGLGVSMPVPWEALDTLTSGAHWTIATAREHLSFQTTDPWAGYWTSKQTLTRALRLLMPTATPKRAPRKKPQG